MTLNTRLISWNVRGIKPNLADLCLLIKNKPNIVCLQETKLPEEDENFQVRDYEPFHYINSGGQIACGGTSILVRKDIPCRKIAL